ncbi:hypothetical protein B0T25DRAFT_515955 [Lasiosphaeria hispida]|uniref:Uncharacterized protein n=1 Tax=Lasiosphaeria hispida TaxID=260671 RepID=A0AAJ0MIV8_9PEZI|nr:hypothetical protein B0T25DRAFT_515955 [Lasiosphaeria hispida]
MASVDISLDTSTGAAPSAYFWAAFWMLLCLGISLLANPETALQNFRAIGKAGKNWYGEFLTTTVEKKGTGLAVGDIRVTPTELPFAPLTIHLFSETLELNPNQRIDAGGYSNLNMQVFARLSQSQLPQRELGSPVLQTPRRPQLRPLLLLLPDFPPPQRSTSRPRPSPLTLPLRPRPLTAATTLPTSTPVPPTLDITLDKGSRLLLGFPSRPGKFSIRLSIPNAHIAEGNANVAPHLSPTQSLQTRLRLKW